MKKNIEGCFTVPVCYNDQCNRLLMKSCEYIILYVIVGYGGTGTGAGGPGSAPLTPQQCKTFCCYTHC